MRKGLIFSVVLAAVWCGCAGVAQQLPVSADFQDQQPSTRPVHEPLPVPAQAGVSVPQPSATQQPLVLSAQPSAQGADPSSADGLADPQLKQNPLTALREFQPEADEEYLLGRGDEITVDFAGRPDLQAKLIIGPDGRITLPLAGEIVLNGRTRSDAARRIEAALGTYYQNLTAQVTVTKYTANHVLVLGAVDKPGLVTFEGQPTLLEALTRAGMTPGPPPHNNAFIPERCAIYRGQDKVVWVELKKLIDSGNALAGMRLRRDDVIYVPSAAESFVSLLGEVGRPGAVPLTSSSTLASVLAQSGGLTAKAGSNPRIQVIDPTSGASRMIAFSDVLNPVKAREFTLKPGEIIYVPQSGFARATYILERLNPLVTAGTFVAIAGGVF